MNFQPKPDQALSIDDCEYYIAEHPSAPGIPYGQEGRQATVYQLITESGKKHALKVFKPQFRNPSLVVNADHIQPLASLPGLQVCKRVVLTSGKNRDLLSQYPDLTYAVLMPWIEGTTWAEYLLEKRGLSLKQSLYIATTFAKVLVTMEERGIAHCDLSGANIILAPDLSSISLVDVEGMYTPGLIRPDKHPAGSPGYTHLSASNDFWSSQADRFPGALLIVEMLSWCQEEVQQATWGESYFKPGEVGKENERYHTLVNNVNEIWGEPIVKLFRRSWKSSGYSNCPTFGEWVVSLPEGVPKEHLIYGSENITEQDINPETFQLLMEAQQRTIPGQAKSALEIYRKLKKHVPPKTGNEREAPIIKLEKQTNNDGDDPSPDKYPPQEKKLRFSHCEYCSREIPVGLEVCPYCENIQPNPEDNLLPPWARWAIRASIIGVLAILITLTVKKHTPSYLKTVIDTAPITETSPVQTNDNSFSDENDSDKPEGSKHALGTEENPIVWAFVPFDESEQAKSSFKDVANLINEKTGLVIEPFVATEYAGVIEAICSDPPQAHISSLSTFSYILASERGCAEAVLVAVRFGSATYNGQIFVRADSGIDSIEDLEGKSFCRPDPLSTSGWIIPSIELKAAGIDPQTDLAEIVNTGSHDTAVTGVYNRDCAAGGSYVGARTTIVEDYPDVMDVVQVIKISPDIPNHGIQLIPEFPEEKKKEIVNALLEIMETEVGRASLFHDISFVWTEMEKHGDSFYDPFREALDAAGVSAEELQ